MYRKYITQHFARIRDSCKSNPNLARNLPGGEPRPYADVARHSLHPFALRRFPERICFFLKGEDDMARPDGPIAVCVINLEGGVGKSTISALLAMASQETD
jgi:hypothetical protein